MCLTVAAFRRDRRPNGELMRHTTPTLINRRREQMRSLGGMHIADGRLHAAWPVLSSTAHDF